MNISCLLFCLAATWATCARGLDPDSLEEWRAKMQPITPRGYVCQHTETPVEIDGQLGDAAWADAPWTEDFADIEGPSKPKPRLRTRAKMLWDNDYLYIAAEMQEPHVWGTLTEHDSVIFQDPDFEMFIDPDGDTHDYFEFEMNALNTGWDLYLPKPYKDGGKADNAWEIPGLKSAVHIRGTVNNPADLDEGWSVEIAFPWKALGAKANRPAPPREGDQWRIGFSRVEWQIETKNGRYMKVPNTPENNWVWSPQGVIDMHRPERWGYVQFTHAKTAAFIPDRAAPTRNALQEIYYAQRAFRKQHRRWAVTLDELGILRPDSSAGVATLRSTPEGWNATIELPVVGAASRHWTIAHDARVWAAP